MELKTACPHVRPLNRDHLDLFNHYGHSVRGFVIELDGEVVAIYGIMHTNPLQAFSVMDDKLKPYPKTIMRAILSFKKIMAHYNKPIYAKPSVQKKNSKRVLARIGFEPTDEGEFYVWKP